MAADAIIRTMALPPGGYPAEGGANAPCGWTWKQNAVVTGEISGFDFGASEKTILPPIVYPGNVPKVWGKDADSEAAFADKIQQAIIQTTADVNALAAEDPDPSNGFEPNDSLTAKQVNSLAWLLAHAQAQLEAAAEIYDFWAHRFGGPWPLSLGDFPSNFTLPAGIDARSHPCSGNNGEWVDGRGRVDKVMCPANAEMVRRPFDREKVRARLMDAIHHVRCAQWGMWRLVLYGRAVNAWDLKHPVGGLVAEPVGPIGPVSSGAPGGFAAPYSDPLPPGDLTTAPPTEPPAPTGPGGLTTGPPSPPDEPGDFHLPDPGELPPPDQIPDGEGAGTDGAGGASDRSEPVLAGEDKPKSLLAKVIPVAAVVGLGAIAVRVLK